MRELKFKLSDPTLTANVNQTLSDLLSQTNKVSSRVTIVESVATSAYETANNPSIALENLTDVSIVQVSDGQTIAWSAQNKVWQNRTASGGAVFNTGGNGGFWSCGFPLQYPFGTAMASGTIMSVSGYPTCWEFCLESSWTISSVGVVATSSIGSTYADVGIYDASGNLLLHSGNLDCSTAGEVTASITPVKLPSGTYYFACGASYSGVQLLGFAPNSNVGLINLLNASPGALKCAYGSNALSGGTLPATLGTLTTSSANQPNIPGALFAV